MSGSTSGTPDSVQQAQTDQTDADFGSASGSTTASSAATPAPSTSSVSAGSFLANRFASHQLPASTTETSPFGAAEGTVTTLLSGKASSAVSGLLSKPGSTTPSVGASFPSAATDFRARLSPINADDVYGTDTNVSTNILAILRRTNGIVFPYTPQISFQQDVDYQELGMVHTNQDYYSYQRTPSVSLSVVGKFTVQNQQEGQYALAVIHFLRTASKMYFGEQAGAKAGLPPPMLQFNAYGAYMFNKLPVILKSHSYALNDGTDMVQVKAGGQTIRLPSLFEVSMTIIVQQTPAAQRAEFNLDKFRTGALMRTNGGWI